MELFRSITGTSLISPGANLSGRDKVAFDELKSVIDRCTHDLLIRPDWVANMELIDLANSERSQAVMAEVVVILRNKICAKDAKVVLMTLCLVEAMVKNGTQLVHTSIGSDFFMKEMANTARKYNAKLGQDNREIVDQCLNMIQCWGEGFAASGRQSQFPAFSKYYYDLRREGLPFNQNFDASQLPDFSPPVGSANAGPSAAQEMEDEILAAALAASLNTENSQPRPQSERVGSYGSSNAGPYQDYPVQSAYPVGNVVSVSSSSSSGGGGGGSFAELTSSATSSCALLRDMINASASSAELRSNDIAEEVAAQIRGYQSSIMSSVELALTSYPEAVEGLFQSAEECGTVLSQYTEKRKGGATYMPAGFLPKSRHGVEPSIAHPPVHTPAVSTSAPKPLLDFSDQGDDEIGNPMLMVQQSQNSSARKAEPVSTTPVQTRTVQPPPPVPTSPPSAQFAASSSAKVVSPSISSSAFQPTASGHGAVVDDPFGNTSSIDALLTPAPATSATSHSKTESDDLLDFLSK